MIRRFNAWLGDKLALWLSTMACFYIVFGLVIVPLFFQHPNNLVEWVQYMIQTIFQGVALPVIGYVARIAGEKDEKIISETHDAVMEELGLVKEELALAREQYDTLQKVEKVISETHDTVMEELTLVKEELVLAREQHVVLQKVIDELQQHLKEK
ncbi:hypothetical protein WAX78_19415 [Bacillus sp. FJAT-53711]|uniref:Uncharacterized protein n=1 Tax=Bacillus yunxiaonensis TaxID=3127665 RepID=A0ABU8G024_9BACI